MKCCSIRLYIWPYAYDPDTLVSYKCGAYACVSLQLNPTKFRFCSHSLISIILNHSKLLPTCLFHQSNGKVNDSIEKN